jgi:hypothetical protein
LPKSDGVAAINLSPERPDLPGPQLSAVAPRERVSAAFQALLSESACPLWVEGFANAELLDNSRWYAPDPAKPGVAEYHRNPVHAWILDERVTAPDRAAVNRSIARIWQLLEASGAVPKFASEIDPATGLTPLMRACESNWTWIYFRSMVESRWFPALDVDVRSRPRGGTVLHHAFMPGFGFPGPEESECLRRKTTNWIAIARRMTRGSLNAVDAAGHTVLSLSLRCGLFGVARFLVEDRADQLDLFVVDASGLGSYELASAMLAETAPAYPERRAPLAQREHWEFVPTGGEQHLALVELRALLFLATRDHRRLLARSSGGSLPLSPGWSSTRSTATPLAPRAPSPPVRRQVPPAPTPSLRPSFQGLRDRASFSSVTRSHRQLHPASLHSWGADSPAPPSPAEEQLLAAAARRGRKRTSMGKHDEASAGCAGRVCGGARRYAGRGSVVR